MYRYVQDCSSYEPSFAVTAKWQLLKILFEFDYINQVRKETTIIIVE